MGPVGRAVSSGWAGCRPTSWRVRWGHGLARGAPRDTGWARGRRAFLLVEATLTAVIIAVGLVLISRGIGGSLNALSRLQAYDRLLQLAEAKLSDLEIEAQQFHALARRSGIFESPDAENQWTLEARRVQIADLSPAAVNRITLTVRSSRARSPTVSLATFWPSDWLSE